MTEKRPTSDGVVAILLAPSVDEARRRSFEQRADRRLTVHSGSIEGHCTFCKATVWIGPRAVAKAAVIRAITVCETCVLAWLDAERRAHRSGNPEEDGPPIGQEHLDIVAIQSFHEALWDRGRRFPCSSCQSGNHQNCRRWHTVRVPEPIVRQSTTWPTECECSIRDELYICGCSCPIAKQIQWLKGEPEAAR